MRVERSGKERMTIHLEDKRDIDVMFEALIGRALDIKENIASGMFGGTLAGEYLSEANEWVEAFEYCK